MSHKCCNLYYSFPLIFGINFRYEHNYVQVHNNIDELVIRENIYYMAVIDKKYCHVIHRLICSNVNNSIYI